MFPKGELNMKKISILILLFVMSFVCFGCSKEIIRITDLSEYSTMTKETDRIDVTFDNNTGVPFYFSITNEEEIKQIMHIIFTGILKKQSKEINDGNHTSIKIIQGEKTYSMHVTNIKSGKYYYYFEYSELQHKIGEFAREAGAYDGAK